MIVYYNNGKKPESYRASDYNVCSGMMEIELRDGSGVIIPNNIIDHVEVGWVFKDDDKKECKNNGRKSSIGFMSLVIFAILIFGSMEFLKWFAIKGWGAAIIISFDILVALYLILKSKS